jgi:hypothetical protein
MSDERNGALESEVELIEDLPLMPVKVPSPKQSTGYVYQQPVGKGATKGRLSTEGLPCNNS